MLLIGDLPIALQGGAVDNFFVCRHLFPHRELRERENPVLGGDVLDPVVFQALKEYFTDDVKVVIDRLARNSTGFTKEEINYLIEIKKQVEILNERLIEIKNLNFGALKDVDKVISALNRQKIDLELLTHITVLHYSTV